jgi:hypothetical protein
MTSGAAAEIGTGLLQEARQRSIEEIGALCVGGQLLQAEAQQQAKMDMNRRFIAPPQSTGPGPELSSLNLRFDWRSVSGDDLTDRQRHRLSVSSSPR